MTRAAIAATCFIILSASTTSARAQPPTVESCATAYEEAQRRQAKGALVDAREQASTCANVACPADIVSVCAAMAEDLDRTIPSIVVAALDAQGKDVAGARVVIDGKQPGAALDGRPLSLDPGQHRLRLVSPSASDEPVEIEVSVLAGDRNKRVEGRFATRSSTPPVDPAAPRSGPGPVLIASAIAFAFGGAGVIVGSVTGGLALSEESTLTDLCPSPTTCPAEEQDRIDRAAALATSSTTGFVLGGVGVATGVVLLIVGVTQPRDSAVSASARGLALRF